MKCPNDGTDLVMAERQGVEIDYCPKCRGVWLDRGELDKVIERSAAMAPPPQAAPPPATGYPTRNEYGYERPHHRPHHKKRKSWLGDMFDFD